jgi:hypothetical protein
MNPVKRLSNGRRSPLGRARRPAHRLRHRPVARLRPGMRYWSRPPNPARLLSFLVRRIIKFHESEPLLAGPPE